MEIHITAAEAQTLLPAVPVCIGCERPASGVRHQTLRPARPESDAHAGGGSAEAAADLLPVALLGLAHLDFSKQPEAVEAICPVCWFHRWIIPPSFAVKAVRGGEVWLTGVSKGFAAALGKRRRPVTTKTYYGN